MLNTNKTVNPLVIDVTGGDDSCSAGAAIQANFPSPPDDAINSSDDAAIVTTD